MSEEHANISQDRVFFFEEQEVTVNDFDASGYILDIGAGGEGIIGRLKGQQVIAIDPNKRELEGAPPGPLKIVMDATDLQFLDCTFRVATSFFTLMYIQERDHAKAVSEVFRVLKPGGRFLIWDAIVPQPLDEDKNIAAFGLLVKLPNEEIETGYGNLWPDEEHDVPYYVRLAEDAGFEVAVQKQSDRLLFLELPRH